MTKSSEPTGNAQDVTHREARTIILEEPKLGLAQPGRLFSKISWPGFFGGCTVLGSHWRVFRRLELKDFCRFLPFVYVCHLPECVDALPVSLVKVISQEGVCEEVARAMHAKSQQQRFLFVVVQFNRVDESGGAFAHSFASILYAILVLAPQSCCLLCHQPLADFVSF